MGGNVFEGTVPLAHEHKADFVKLIMNAVEPFSVYPVGSAGYFSTKDQYNDLDFVLEAKEDHYWDTFISFIHRDDMATDGIKKITNQCYSVMLRNPVTELWHQVDFMRSRDFNWSRLMFHSPFEESKYKGAHRNILLMAMVKVCSQKEHYVGDWIVRTRKHLDLYDGLVFMVQTKSKVAKRFNTIEKVPITLDFWTAINQFVPCNSETLMVKLDSFETTFEIFFRYFYRHRGDQKTWISILKETKEMLESAKLEIPNEMSIWNEVPAFV
jgi:hypothetical protein